MTQTHWITAGIVIFFCGATAGALHADDTESDWPQWRGPNRDSGVHGESWPDRIGSDRLKPTWRFELPPSYSGPVVSSGAVFVTYTRDEKYEGVRALDRRSGEELWTTEWDGAMEVAKIGASMGSWIRATPTLDEDALYVAGMRDVLVCLDSKTGEERWRADFHERFGTPIPELGLVCSPLVVGDRVYGQAADSLVCVDKQTGESVWRCLERADVGQGAYSSPDVAVVHGRPQVLVANIPAIAGVDPQTGEVLWKRELDSYAQGCILAPIVYGDGIFTSTRASRTGFYPLTINEGQFSISDGWKNGLTIYMSSPAVIGDHAYAHLKNGRFACIDLRNGEQNWISPRPFGRYASMAWCKDRILALTEEGELLLIRAVPDRFELLDSRVISEDETWGHLAVAGRDIFIRERGAIAAYRWE